jgi:hypothetical protein
MASLPTDRAERRTCLTIDLENYSKLEGPAQDDAQRGLSDALAAAAAAAGLERMSWVRQESGDRELAVLPSEEDIPRALGEFPYALDERFRALHSRTGVWLRARMAISQGMVKAAPMGIAGWGPCDVTRISDAPAVYHALRNAHGAYLVLAISAELYRDYVQQGHTTMKPDQFRQVDVPDINGSAWITLPRIDPSQIPVYTADAEPEPTAAGHQQVNATNSSVVQSGRDSVNGSYNNTYTRNDFHSPVQIDTMHFGPRHG